jgi:hypothetical protein
MVAGIPGAGAAQLHPATVKAWENYVRSADERMQSRLGGQRPFLWMDEADDRRPVLQRGEVLVAPATERGTQNVPEGLIHDWIGAAFLPHATIATLMHVLGDYESYKHIYKPFVTRARLLSFSPGDLEFAMTWHRKVLFVNAAIEGRYRTHHFPVDAHRGYSIANTTEIHEIANYGSSNEHLLDVGAGNGYVWRLHGVTRYQERDGGVYLEVEAMALTRPIPGSLSWLVGPVVNRLSINSLITMLRQTRDAVDAARVRTGWKLDAPKNLHHSGSIRVLSTRCPRPRRPTTPLRTTPVLTWRLDCAYCRSDLLARGRRQVLSKSFDPSVLPLSRPANNLTSAPSRAKWKHPKQLSLRSRWQGCSSACRSRRDNTSQKGISSLDSGRTSFKRAWKQSRDRSIRQRLG